MVVGDRGLVVREFSSRLGGVDHAAPSFSVLCDKVELGMPNGLKQLVAGDFVKAKLEILVLPRKGAEFNLAMNNVGSSRSLTQISSMDTSGRVDPRKSLCDIPVIAHKFNSQPIGPIAIKT